MQDTRLNRLVETLSGLVGQWLRNPWRRISLVIISLLFGFFLGTAISTIAGQEGYLDILYAAICLLLVEGVNWLTYHRNQNLARSFGVEILKGLKLGLTYSLFVEAFKLGS